MSVQSEISDNTVNIIYLRERRSMATKKSSGTAGDKTGGPGIQDIAGVAGCCRVESIITIDERGQMVLPKEVRTNAGLKAGDKMAVVVCESGQSKGCIVMLRVEQLADMVRAHLGPMLGEILKPKAGE
jgi:antitoxin PrlF